MGRNSGTWMVTSYTMHSLYKQVYSSNAKIDINKLIIHLTIYNIITHINCNFEVSVSNIVRFSLRKRQFDMYHFLL